MSKVELIKAEIERRIVEIPDANDGVRARRTDKIEYKVLNDLLYFINTLPEEPVSEDLEEAAKKHAFTMSGEDEVQKYESFKAGAQWKDSVPVSEDLEEAAVEAFKNIVDEDRNSFLEIFKAGAQWKEQQMMKGLCYETQVYLDSDGDDIEIPHSEWLALENRDMIKIPKSLEHILDTPEKIAELEKSIIALREYAQKECQQWSEYLKAKGE